MRSNTIRRAEAPVCQLCSFITSRPATRPRSLRIQTTTKSLRQFSISQSAFSTRPQAPASPLSPAAVKTAGGSHNEDAVTSSAASEAQIDKELKLATELRDRIIQTQGTPNPIDIMKLLTAYEDIASKLRAPIAPQAQKTGSATSALLNINKAAKSVLLQPRKLSPKASNKLSELALSVLEHPAVFITPEMLGHFVDLHTILGRPEALPVAFNLYAHKPMPIQGSKPLKFREPNPNKSANAIEKSIADRALQVAIDAKQLVVAMDIVDTTYNTTAYRRAKFIKKALFPAVGLSLAPVAAYVVASKLAMYQTTMDPAVATNIAFVGLCGYITFTSVVGVVAVTTANDQMERITWTQGLPLRERWLREDERAAIDKMAMAWGFKELWKRGEEEGDEWEHLREWVAARGMILDKTELMEGME